MQGKRFSYFKYVIVEGAGGLEVAQNKLLLFVFFFY